VPAGRDGDVHGFFVLVVDVSARKHAEDARRELDRRAHESLEGLARLAGGLAHEINNPLTVTLGTLDQLVAELDTERPPEPPALREALIEARDAARRIVRITEGMKLLSLGRDDRRELVDLDRTIESSLALAANAYRYRATLERDLRARCAVRGDAAQLSNVFVQLVLNAAESMPPRPLAENVIRVRARAEAGHAEITVEDNGGGIPPDVGARMFEPFFTTKPVGQGVGLGLTIALSIVQAFDGTLVHEDEPGLTRFRVRLPIAATLDARSRRPEAPVRAAPRAHILVVDDDPGVTRSLQRLLQAHYDVRVQNDPERALDELVRGDTADLVLCDLMMPRLHGGELFRIAIAARPELRDRFVFMTGGAFADEVRAFVALERPLVVSKPFEVAALRQHIAARLAQLREAE
jgi:nitrogen-specific signal transduction histidine kinase/CheY-like chemotaxis protein